MSSTAVSSEDEQPYYLSKPTRYQPLYHWLNEK